LIRRPDEIGAFQFVVVSVLRAAQLTRGCRPRVDGDHTNAVFAQREVAEGKVVATMTESAAPYRNGHVVEAPSAIV
jgi:hypothetical protein